MKDESLWCDVCGRSYKNYERYKIHMLKVHYPPAMLERMVKDSPVGLPEVQASVASKADSSTDDGKQINEKL